MKSPCKMLVRGLVYISNHFLLAMFSLFSLSPLPRTLLFFLAFVFLRHLSVILEVGSKIGLGSRNPYVLFSRHIRCSKSCISLITRSLQTLCPCVPCAYYNYCPCFTYSRIFGVAPSLPPLCRCLPHYGGCMRDRLEVEFLKRRGSWSEHQKRMGYKSFSHLPMHCRHHPRTYAFSSRDSRLPRLVLRVGCAF